MSTDSNATLTWIDSGRTDLLEPQFLDDQANLYGGQRGPCVLFQISDPTDGTIIGGWLARRCRSFRGYGMYATAAGLQKALSRTLNSRTKWGPNGWRRARRRPLF